MHFPRGFSPEGHSVLPASHPRAASHLSPLTRAVLWVLHVPSAAVQGRTEITNPQRVRPGAACGPGRAALQGASLIFPLAESQNTSAIVSCESAPQQQPEGAGKSSVPVA